MLVSSAPTKFGIPWGYSAGTAYIRAIPTASQASITPGAASLTDGFPPLNAEPVAAGGIPPFMQDFNGIFNQVTSWLRWFQGGGPVNYDATFSASIGGYPKGAVISSATLGLFWISTVDNNTSDPDTGGAGWTTIQSRPNTWTATQSYAANILSANNFGVYGTSTTGVAYVLSTIDSANYHTQAAGPAGFRITNSTNTGNVLTLDNNGNVVASSGVTASAFDAGGAQFRATAGNYGVIIRNDGTSASLLQTASGSPYGTYNTLRPFYWNLASGAVTIDATGAGTTFGGTVYSTARLRAALGATGSGDQNSATILSDFPATFLGNGYQKLPSGWIIQWGTSAVTTTGTGLTSLDVTLPITFPNVLLWSMAGWDGSTPPSSGSVAAQGVNTSAIMLTTYSPAAAVYGVAYFAIGY